MLNGVITSTYLHDGSTNPPAPSDKYVEEGIKSTYLHKGSNIHHTLWHFFEWCNHINLSSKEIKNPPPPLTNTLNGVNTSIYLHNGSKKTATPYDKYVECGNRINLSS
jgi:hypothetical protein